MGRKALAAAAALAVFGFASAFGAARLTADDAAAGGGTTTAKQEQPGGVIEVAEVDSPNVVPVAVVRADSIGGLIQPPAPTQTPTPTTPTPPRTPPPPRQPPAVCLPSC